ncbi:MAG: hypothetical protein WC365_03795 [Candidatus Babeliales bacterium]|jgi:hypothetical protein
MLKNKWLSRTACCLATVLFPLHAEDIATSNSELSSDLLKERIAQEIAAQIKPKEQKPHHHRGSTHYLNRGFAKTDGAIYLLPHWPYYTQFFEDNDLFQFIFTFDTASHAYAGRGGSEQLSQLIFGEPTIHVQNILLASKLAHMGDIIAHPPLEGPGGDTSSTIANHYLSVLADQEINLHASLDEYNFVFDYARHFMHGDITLGIHLPLKIRHQRLKLTNDISSENYTKLKNIERGYSADGQTFIPGLAQATEFQFYKQFDGLEDFVEEIVHRKGMSFNHNETVFGISDVVAYLNFDIPSRHFDRFVTGLSLLIPTTNGRDVGKLWYDDLGNGGFVELAGFISFLWQRSRWLNPYMHLKGTYSFSGNVNRRVTMDNTYDGQKTFNNTVRVLPGQPAHGLIIFGETFNFIAKEFREPDATARCFSDGTRKIKIQPGAELFCRFGNTFDALFTSHGFLDIFYDLRVHGKDYVLRKQLDSLYQPSLLSHNTSSVANTLGFTYCYQFDAQIRSRLGLDYTFAGRNVPKTFEVLASLNIEF